MTEEYWFVQHNFKVGDDLVNVRGRDVQHLIQNVREYADVVGELAQLKANLQGAQSLGQMTAPAPHPAPTQQAAPQQQSQGWGAAQQQPQQQSAPQGGGSKFAGPPHPEGKTCAICPNVLEFKKTSTGKGTWRCSEWRWNNGTPNGHSSEFAN